MSPVDETVGRCRRWTLHNSNIQGHCEIRASIQILRVHGLASHSQPHITIVTVKHVDGGKLCVVAFSRFHLIS